MQYLKLYLIGLPGVGKTTFRKRLTRSLSNISSLPPEERRHFSTHLAECIQTLCIIRDESKLELEISENIDEEARSILKYIHGMTYIIERAISNTDNTIQPNVNRSPIIDSEPVITELNIECEHPNPVENQVEAASLKLNRILEFLQNIGPVDYENVLSMHKILINIIDIGGQPGFLEMLPFVCGGAGIFFVFFPLDKDFDQQYQVSYERNERRITPYEANFTVRETISQILSGISYHTLDKCQPAKLNKLQERISQVEPTVTLVGTFRDKLKLQIKQEVIQHALQHHFPEISPEEIKREIDGILLAEQQKIQGSSFRSNLEKAIDEQLSSESIAEEVEARMTMELENKHRSAKEATSKSYFNRFMVNPPGNKSLFEVDNYEGTDEDINPIRAHIQKCLNDESRVIKVPMRPAQLLFGIILRKEYQIVKREECILIGKELKMTDTDIDFTLWYFNQLGTLIYRDDIKNDDGWFKEHVICSPHIIFNSISKLIIEPLLELHSPASKPLSQKECSDWSEKGQFSLETIKRCLTNELNESEIIPVEHLINFLQHVHLLSPIKTKFVSCHSETSKVHYFMPAVLECASQDELLDISHTKMNTPTSLLMFFKYGSSSEIADSVPIGLFCAMVAKLVSDGYDGILGMKWELDDARVKRNLITFNVDCNHRVTLVSHVTCFEVRISIGDDSIDLHGIYTTIMIVLKEINQHVNTSIGFICPCDEHKDTKRLLENCCVIAAESLNTCTFKCSKTKSNINLLDYPQYSPWIVKVCCYY